MRPEPVHRPEQQLVTGGALEVQLGLVLPGEADAAVQLDALGGGRTEGVEGLGEGEPADPLPLWAVEEVSAVDAVSQAA